MRATLGAYEGGIGAEDDLAERVVWWVRGVRCRCGVQGKRGIPLNASTKISTSLVSSASGGTGVRGLRTGMGWGPWGRPMGLVMCRTWGVDEVDDIGVGWRDGRTPSKSALLHILSGVRLLLFFGDGHIPEYWLSDWILPCAANYLCK